MDRQTLGQLYPITLSPCNPQWPQYYLSEKNHLLEILNAEVRIEHIGSTAIKGLISKPTIDILVEQPAGMDQTEIITQLTAAGYIPMQEQTRHLMFVKGYTPTGLAEISYHIHMGPLEQAWLWDRIYFRDYLIRYQAEMKNYEQLKKKLAAEFQFDREAYTNGKTEYVNRITARAKNELSKNTT